VTKLRKEKRIVHTEALDQGNTQKEKKRCGKSRSIVEYCQVFRIANSLACVTEIKEQTITTWNLLEILCEGLFVNISLLNMNFKDCVAVIVLTRFVPKVNVLIFISTNW
jgi:hypothetical protein